MVERSIRISRAIRTDEHHLDPCFSLITLSQNRPSASTDHPAFVTRILSYVTNNQSINMSSSGWWGSGKTQPKPDVASTQRDSQSNSAVEDWYKAFAELGPSMYPSVEPGRASKALTDMQAALSQMTYAESRIYSQLSNLEGQSQILLKRYAQKSGRNLTKHDGATAISWVKAQSTHQGELNAEHRLQMWCLT